MTRLRDAIHRAEVIVILTPEFAGALPGGFKNLLDWTIGDDLPGSIFEIPVAWINASPRGARGAHTELRTVLAYAHAKVVEAARVEVPVTPAILGDDGLVSDPGVHNVAGDLFVASAPSAPGCLDVGPFALDQCSRAARGSLSDRPSSVSW